MPFKCDQCNEYCSTNSNLQRHKKRCHDKKPIFNRIEMTNKMENKIVLKLSNDREIILENSNGSTNKHNFLTGKEKDKNPIIPNDKTRSIDELIKEKEKDKSNIILNNETQSIEELIKGTDNGNKTDQLLMIAIKKIQEISRQNQEINRQNQEINRQNQELKERLEKLESKPASNTLQINNTINNTVNIYLNENTDLYKIFDDYGIENKNKIAKLAEICNEKNKLGYLIRDPMKDYITKNNLLYADKKKIYMKKDEKGFAQMNLNELNMMSNRMVDSLYSGIWKNYIIPLGNQAIEYGENKKMLALDEQDRIEKEKKEKEERIKLELRRKRNEDIMNGVKGADNRDIEEEYSKLMSLERLTSEKLKLIDDEANYNPILDEYFDEIYNKYGSGLINLVSNRKKREVKSTDKNILIEEYEKQII